MLKLAVARMCNLEIKSHTIECQTYELHEKFNTLTATKVQKVN